MAEQTQTINQLVAEFEKVCGPGRIDFLSQQLSESEKRVDVASGLSWSLAKRLAAARSLVEDSNEHGSIDPQLAKDLFRAIDGTQ